MNSVCRDIFTAIHKGQWLSIEYKNKDGNVTRYWIAIRDVNVSRRMLTVDGLHLGILAVTELNIFIDSIQSSAIVEGTYAPIYVTLVNDINTSPEKYKSIFDSIPNLKILNYLSDCNRLDATPYRADYALIDRLDIDRFKNGICPLEDGQFAQIVQNFQMKSRQESEKPHFKQLGINVISIPSKQGLYVLAYRKLELDVAQRCLRASETITLCKEFSIEGEKISIHQFLDAEDFALLADIEGNLESIKDCIKTGSLRNSGADDRPFIIAVGMDIPVDLEHEYAAIIDMYNKESVSAPVRAFFGDYVKRAGRRKALPLALVNKKVNLDQLLAINDAMKYPLTYVQGPPGTGKTNTIINTIMTAFFNEQTVLFTSYNNHPIDGVFKALQGLQYHGKTIPFPMARLGNNGKIAESLRFIQKQYEQVRQLEIYEKTLSKNHDSKVQRTEKLTQMLSAYEEMLSLRERKEVVERLLEENHQLNFQYELRGKQLAQIESRLDEIGEIRTEDALQLLTDDEDEFRKYLYFTSARYLKRLDEPKNKDLLDILYMEGDDDERVLAFNRYLQKGENVKKFLRIFPIVATTCISAHRIGEPEPYFDMTIMDEASQCNTAVSLVPIIRGRRMMLVGDPQQLSPVILLDAADNLALRRKYNVSADYDYIANSIYKTYLACDAVSEEVLLSYHYRCHEKIIDFNNRKYYNGKLKIRSNVQCDRPLVFVDVKDAESSVKNTSPMEALQILQYVRKTPQKDVGIITPFASQRKLILSELAEAGFPNIPCGTVHAFQGDEKDVILFSLAITDQTHEKTYGWLKNNKELINVATSRAREQLILLASYKNVIRFHKLDDEDDLYELVQYIRSNGESRVTQRTAMSRALGIKPYSTETEEAFLQTLNHAIGNLQFAGSKYTVKKEVAIAQVFRDNPSYTDLFYTGRFDFVVYERMPDKSEMPVLAIELDGKEHFADEVVKARDRKKNAICAEHHFQLIRVENSYARRYHYIKDILSSYFGNR